MNDSYQHAEYQPNANTVLIDTQHNLIIKPILNQSTPNQHDASLIQPIKAFYAWTNTQKNTNMHQNINGFVSDGENATKQVELFVITRG